LATYKHFTSWLTLAPKNKTSGARLISSRTQPSANKAAGLLRMSAMVLGRTSTARKLAILVYRTLKGELEYADPGESAYDEQHRERTLRNVRSRAKRLGFGLVDLETGELVQGAVT
jgi:transposase